MRKSLCVGILEESKYPWEKRAPLTPEDVAWLVQRGIRVEVISSSQRVFPDRAYRRAGAKVVSRFNKASLLLGVKEPDPKDLIREKLYCIFSHTAKKQPYNRPLLKEMIRRKITLMDYEYIKDRTGNRAVYFGRFAGICGMIDCLHSLGRKLALEGIHTPLESIKSSQDYKTLSRAKRHLPLVLRDIRRKGFPEKITPLIIGITGHGNVSQGAQEILQLLGAIEIHPKDIHAFVKHQKKRRSQIYKIVFTREEKFRAKKGDGFYFEEYLKEPHKFQSNLDQYLPYLALLIHASYWDRRYPRLVTKKMIHALARQKSGRLALIGDLTCDVGGAIEITQKTTTPSEPVFTYKAKTKAIRDGFHPGGVSVLAIDNLPAEFPKDASEEFSAMIRDYIYQIAAHGILDLTNHHAIPAEIRHAVICQGGRLTGPFGYLKDFVRRGK